jgi:hypothetical protein
MFLSSGPSIEFIKYFQVLSWIFLAIGLPVILVTVYLHYRRKRAGRPGDLNSGETLVQASPELLGYTKGDGEYVFFDHSILISEYKKKLSYNLARFSSLKKDYEKLENLNREASRVIASNDALINSLQEELKTHRAAALALQANLSAREKELEQYYLSLVSIPGKEDPPGLNTTGSFLQNPDGHAMAVH